MNINGAWEGEYIYGADYPAALIGIRVKLRVDIVTNGSEVEGRFTDDDTKDIFPQGGVLTGVYENTFISLSMQYPHAWGYTETGERFFDKKGQSHIIQNEAFFDGEKYEGEWEIPLIETDESGGMCGSATETIGRGTWWMKRVV